jgi:hypothetical protein
MRRDTIETAVDGLIKSLTRSAKIRFKDRYEAAKKELEKFKERMKDDLVRYTEALADGDLTKEQFKQLVADNMRLLEMKGLTQAGLTAVEVDKYKAASMKKILSTTFNEVLPAVLSR